MLTFSKNAITKKILCLLIAHSLCFSVCAFTTPYKPQAFPTPLSKSLQTVSSITGITQHASLWERMRHQAFISPTAPPPRVQKHIKRFASKTYIHGFVNSASPYLFFILEEVEKNGMPCEIALLPMIESTFNPYVVSPKGAAGLWQLMPSLGRLYGLKQNGWYDGRKDIYESTKAALTHLNYLHQRFQGNWLLTLAAYNAGETKVRRAIAKNKSLKKPTDFWSLSLPQETLDFVPKILALATLIKNPVKYGVNLPSIPNQPVFARIHTGKAIHLTHAAKIANIPEGQLKKLNPGLHKKSMHPSGPYHLVVPIAHAIRISKHYAQA